MNGIYGVSASFRDLGFRTYHKSFYAWYPVRLSSGDWVWFTIAHRLYRKTVSGDKLIGIYGN